MRFSLDVASDRLLAGQIDYYRRRASEYDDTALEDVDEARRLFGTLIERLAPSGDVLEIACGTGLWTQHLVSRAANLTALDSSPEMIDLARERVGNDVEFAVGDVFEWTPRRHYDTIFFGFWLSHVPRPRLAAFWRLLERWLAADGRVLFVDEGSQRASMEPKPLPGRAGIAERQLRDGTVHTIVKVFYEAEELGQTLAGLGWSAEIEPTADGFMIGTAGRE